MLYSYTSDLCYILYHLHFLHDRCNEYGQMPSLSLTFNNVNLLQINDDTISNSNLCFKGEKYFSNIPDNDNNDNNHNDSHIRQRSECSCPAALPCSRSAQ